MSANLAGIIGTHLLKTTINPDAVALLQSVLTKSSLKPTLPLLARSAACRWGILVLSAAESDSIDIRSYWGLCGYRWGPVRIDVLTLLIGPNTIYRSAISVSEFL